MFVNDIKNTNHRFSDVAGEPCVMLAPIEGFNKKPLLTLEQATEPLNNVVPRIDTYVHVAKERVTNPADDLSVDESASIALYTMEWSPYTESLYYILNNTLRSENRQNLKPWFLYLKLLLTALSRLPSVNLTVYRGVEFTIESDHEKYQIGRRIVWWGFSSCSINRDVSEKDNFLGQTGTKTIFTIDCMKGKDIGAHSYFKQEREVLLLPATKVEVINYEQKNDLHLIHLREIESPFVLLEAVSSEQEIRNLKNATVRRKKLSAPTAPEPENRFNAKLNDYIARFKPQSEAYLIGKRFTEHDVKLVVQQLMIDKQCRVLFLRESNITSEGASIIAEALSDNNTLQGLFISHNQLSDTGAKVLAQALSYHTNRTLKQLCLGYNRITDEGIEYVAKMLESNQALTHLWLPSNDISDRGLQRLAEALINTNRTLQVLSLEWNKFRSDTSVKILVGVLTNNKTLTTLNLKSCKLPRSGIKELKSIAKGKEHFKLLIH